MWNRFALEEIVILTVVWNSHNQSRTNNNGGCEKLSLFLRIRFQVLLQQLASTSSLATEATKYDTDQRYYKSTYERHGGEKCYRKIFR